MAAERPTGPWKRVMLKLSGEAFAGDGAGGLDIPTIGFIADEIASVRHLGVEACAVVGGGNYIRGAELAAAGMDRVSADYMGMLGTVINALALREALEKRGIDTRVQTAFPMPNIAESFIRPTRRVNMTLPLFIVRPLLRLQRSAPCRPPWFRFPRMSRRSRTGSK